MSNTEKQEVNPEDKLNDVQKEIWNRIKDREAAFYGLKDMKVKNICTPLSIDPTVLYVTFRGPASLVSIEEVLNADLIVNYAGNKVPRYVIERKDRFGVISKNPEAI